MLDSVQLSLMMGPFFPMTVPTDGAGRAGRGGGHGQ